MGMGGKSRAKNFVADNQKFQGEVREWEKDAKRNK